AALIGDGLAVEGLRAKAALAMRVVDDGEAAAEHLLPQAILEEAGATRDRRAADGADEMAQQARRDARIEHHRHLAGRNLARPQAAHRALAGAAPDFGRIAQIFREDGAGVIIVALHRRALA